MANNNRAKNIKNAKTVPNKGKGYGSKGKKVPPKAVSGNKKKASNVKASYNGSAYGSGNNSRNANAFAEQNRYRNEDLRLPPDKKVKKQRDYFYVMKKGNCFLMFLLLLVIVAVFVLSYLNLAFIPKQYIAVAKDTVVVEEVNEVSNYSVTDPLFGVIKKITGQFMDTPISLGESPLYDKMLAKSDTIDDKIMIILMTYAPVLLILYVLTAIIMMFKAFFGMFGKRIYKKFGLGSFIMILCGLGFAFSMLAFNTEVGAKMAIGKIVDIFMGAFKSVLGLSGGYGLLAIIALPLLTLILGLFSKKKVPYSIFDV